MKEKTEEVKFTEGEWKVEIGEDRCFHQSNRVAITVDWEDGGESGNVTIAEVWPGENDVDIRDGHIMAASKDLYYACQQLMMQLKPVAKDSHEFAAIEDAELAIAKAEGK